MASRPHPPPGARASPARRALPWLAPPVLLGAALRLWGLDRQILVGDEIHGLRAALELPLAEILTAFRSADHCLPLAALYRLLLAGGVPLSELLLRLPSALAGVGALVLFPALLVRFDPSPGGLRRAAAFGWLLAVSPGLVFYSRIARPYAVVALLAPLAAAAFWRWWRGGAHAWAGLYALSGAIAAWFHLAAAPFVAAPLGYGAGELAWRRLTGEETGSRRGASALAGAAAALALGLAAFLVPARESLGWLAETKSAQDSPGLAGVGDVLRLQAGTAFAPLALLFWGLAALGAVALVRRSPGLGGYALTLVAVQWAGIALVLRPEGIGHPVILNRYLLAALPVVLLWVACGLYWAAFGLGALAQRAPGPRRRLDRARAGAAVLVLAGLAATSPYLADPGFRLGSFGGTHAALDLTQEPPRASPSAVPAVYRSLAGEPGDGAVLELVRAPRSYLLGPVLAVARVHGRPVVLAARDAWLADPGLDLRTLVPALPEAIETSGVRFVVLHRSPFWLARALEVGREGAGVPVAGPARRLARDFCAAWGEPQWSSDGALVWDLARPEAGARRGAASGRERCRPRSWAPAPRRGAS